MIDRDIHSQWSVWHLIIIGTALLSTDYFKDLGGHHFQVVTVRYFPYVDFVKSSEEPGADVTFINSLDDELFTLLSAKLNFT